MKNNFYPNFQRSWDSDEAGDFSSFDPDTFDPDNYDAGSAPSKRAMQKRTATFDLVITNTSAAARTVELFNYLRSFTRKRRADYASANGFLYQPLNSLEGAQRVGVGIVGYNQDGDLWITGTSAVVGAFPANFTPGADGAVKITCPQFPYQSLNESSSNVPFVITKIRQTTVTDDQIDQSIVWFSNSFLGGNKENTVNPRTFFRPEQFQSKIVDIPLSLVIDGEKGIRYIINAGETVKWNVTISQYRKLTV